MFHNVVLTFLFIAASIWTGGYVTIAVVARASTLALEPASRIALFRQLGRTYLKVGVPALIVSYATGGLLLLEHGWDALVMTAVMAAILLALVLAIAVGQARRMTRLRSNTTANPRDDARIRNQAVTATALRAVIGVLTLLLIILGFVISG